MDFWGIAVGALIGSLAWIYQRTWEHQEKRVARYQEIIDGLPAFMAGRLDPEGMDKAMSAARHLWLSAPDDVVRAWEKLLDVAEGKTPDPEQRALGECVAAMRRDATYQAVLFPRFWRTRLAPIDFRVRTARRPGAAL